MANVLDNGKDVYHLGMVVKVSHDDKVLVYALIPRRTERGEDAMMEVSHDDKVVVSAINPGRGESTVVKVLHDDKVVVYAINTEEGERGERRRIV